VPSPGRSRLPLGTIRVSSITCRASPIGEVAAGRQDTRARKGLRAARDSKREACLYGHLQVAQGDASTATKPKP
jgi:hypothetical protein